MSYLFSFANSTPTGTCIIKTYMSLKRIRKSRNKIVLAIGIFCSMFCLIILAQKYILSKCDCIFTFQYGRWCDLEAFTFQYRHSFVKCKIIELKISLHVCRSSFTTQTTNRVSSKLEQMMVFDIPGDLSNTIALI